MSNVSFLASSFLSNRGSCLLSNNRLTYNVLIILWFEGFLKYIFHEPNSKRLIVGLSNASILGFPFSLFLSKGYLFKDAGRLKKQNFLEVRLARNFRRNQAIVKEVFSVR